ncbi:MAG: universal stress protein [Polyangiaceae bacterium]|nr:universal stress protein [Polyangiaceae bacterium]
MSGFEHILVPTDFGDIAEQALALGISLASKFDSRLTIIHTTPLAPPSYASYSAGLFWPTDEMVQGAASELEALASRMRTIYPKIESAHILGEPWEAIVEFLQGNGVDLVVMGTHGRQGIAHVLLGSVAEKLVQMSTVPVLTVPGKRTPKTSPPTNTK